MTNGEKYKTAQERAEEFYRFCDNVLICDDCPLGCLHKSNMNACRFAWLDLEVEDDSVVIECNGHRYKAKNAKAHLSGDMLVITGCSGVRGDLSAKIRVENLKK